MQGDLPLPGRASAAHPAWRKALWAVAGPALIVVAVLVVLYQFAFLGRVINGDIPTFFLPSYCFLGTSLAHGHIPGWNPYSMAGAPFAADPQSGWMYLPAMALFSALPCSAAIAAMVVLQPVLAGLGLYAFLRTEELPRPAATAGGLVLALGLSGSELAGSLPFAGALAWTAVALAACSRYVRARTWAGRLVWAGLTATAWGQIAGAHLSIGLVLGALTLVAYLVATLWRSWRTGARSAAAGLALVGLLIAAAASLNLAVLVPRLAGASAQSLGLGYGALDRLSVTVSGFHPLRLQTLPSGPRWPLKLATARGAYLGAAALALAFAGWWSKRHRHLVAGFSALGAGCYLLSIRFVATRVPSSLRTSRLVDFYVHGAQWFGYALPLVIAVLAALGVEAWTSARGWRARAAMVALGVAVWGALPPLFGASATQLWLVMAGAVAGGAALWAAARRPALVALVPLVLAVELGTNGFLRFRPPPFEPIPTLLIALPTPTIDPGRATRPGPLERALAGRSDGRYLRMDVPGWDRLLADPGSSLFGIRSAQGYDPVQLRRYWLFARAAAGAPLNYNLTLFRRPTPVVLDLLQVAYVEAPRWPLPGPAGPALASAGGVTLFAVPGAVPRASLVSRWTVAPGPLAALREVVAPGFDPSSLVVLERAPGIPAAPPGAAAGAGTAAYTAQGDQKARVEVDASRPALLLVRTPFDANWHAQVDGRPAPVLAADYLDQAVPVPAGRHVVRLSYDDPTIGYGLLGSALSLVALALSAALAARAGRRGRSPRSAAEGARAPSAEATIHGAP